MQPIVTLTDFSPNAQNAVEYAAEFALSIQLPLRILYVHQPSIDRTEMYACPDDTATRIDEALENMRALLKDLQSRFPGLNSLTGEVRTGPVEAEIASFCKSENPFAVVMSSHGAGAVEKILVGSCTSWAMGHLPCPVLVIPPKMRFNRVTRLAIAWDYYRHHPLSVLQRIADNIAFLKPELFIVGLLKDTEELSSVMFDESHDIRKVFDRFNPEYDFINLVDVEQGLAAYVRDKNIDLLLVIPEHHSWIGRVFHHSHSEDVALHSAIPVMTFHE